MMNSFVKPIAYFMDNIRKLVFSKFGSNSLTFDRLTWKVIPTTGIDFFHSTTCYNNNIRCDCDH